MKAIPLLLPIAVAAACGQPVTPAAPAPSRSTPGVEVTPDPSVVAGLDEQARIVDASPAIEMQELVPGFEIPKAFPNGIPILTPWEFGLLLLDPNDLELAQRRKRAYARRKVVMNNPDSTGARVLNDLQAAHKAGEIDIPGTTPGVVFSVPGTKPVSGRPPAGHRPEPVSSEPVSGG